MASGSLTAAALRHRPRQAALVVALSAVVSASAVLGPLYARAAEQSVLRTLLTEASAAQRGVVVTSSSNQAPSPRRVVGVVGATTGPQFGTPIAGAEAPVTIGDLDLAGTGVRATGQLTYREGLCRHLQLADGSCQDLGRRPGAVLVSQRNATAFDLAVGEQIRLLDPTDPTTSLTATVVGTYRPFEATGDYWFGRGATAAVPPTQPGQPPQPVLDSLYATWTTLHSASFAQVRTHADVPLRTDRVDLATVPAVLRGASDIDRTARTLPATSTTGLPTLVAASDSQQHQARTVVPLLALQLAVLGVVVLGFVCAAATEGRRPEIALARLRGQGSVGAAGLLYRELGLLVVIGAIVGAVPGWLLARWAASRWLAPGVTLELRGPVLAAVAAAAVAGLLAVTVTAVPTLRQPLVSLLRRVPPRASTLQVGLVEGALVAVAAAGVVTLLTSGGRRAGSAQSPVALLAPGLLAVAGGLLLAQALVPIAGPRVRRALARGNVAAALAGAQVARRPALRRLVAIITVACGLLVFGVDAWAVAERNRTTRAGVEAGAAVVLDVDADSARSLRAAVLQIDPKQTYATPVVTTSSAAEAGPRTIAVEPAAFARIAHWGGAAGTPTAKQLRKLEVPTVPSLPITGNRVEVDLTGRFRGISAALGLPPPPPRPMHLALELTSQHDGRPVSVIFDRKLAQGAGHYVAELPCTSGCFLHRIDVLREFGNFDGADLKVTISRIAVGNGAATTPVELGPDTDAAWQSVSSNDTEVTVDTVAPLSFSGNTFGSAVQIQRGDVPVSPPVLAAGQVLERIPGPGEPEPPAVAPDLNGIEADYDVAGRLPQIPRSGRRGVLVSLDLVVDAAGPPTTQTSYAVWLSADDPARERQLVHRLEDKGVLVTGRDSTAAHEAALSAEGTMLALRLALLAGLIALILAAAVLVVGVATSVTSRARDLAGLRVVGVPARVIRSAAIREHITVSVLGTVAGAVLGLAAAQVALPRVRLFATEGPVLRLAHQPAWSLVLLSTAICLVLLVLVSVLVGRTLAAAATPDRLRQER